MNHYPVLRMQHWCHRRSCDCQKCQSCDWK